MKRLLLVLVLLGIALSVALAVHSVAAFVIAAAFGAASAVIVGWGAATGGATGTERPAVGDALDPRAMRPILDRFTEGVLLLDAADNVLVANRAATSPTVLPGSAFRRSRIRRRPAWASAPKTRSSSRGSNM